MATIATAAGRQLVILRMLHDTFVNLNRLLFVIRVDLLSESVIALMDHYKQLEKPYGVSYDVFREKAERLIFQEARFVFLSPATDSEKLDREWKELLNGMYLCLKYAWHELDFSDEAQRLREYGESVSAARNAILNESLRTCSVVFGDVTAGLAKDDISMVCTSLSNLAQWLLEFANFPPSIINAPSRRP